MKGVWNYLETLALFVKFDGIVDVFVVDRVS